MLVHLLSYSWNHQNLFLFISYDIRCLNWISFWRVLFILQESWQYFAVCLPVVVVFAPIGSFIASYLHRLTLACMIYVLETVALVGTRVLKIIYIWSKCYKISFYIISTFQLGALLIIRPSWPLLLASAALIVGSFIFYSTIGQYGKKLAKVVPQNAIIMKQITVASPH